MMIKERMSALICAVMIAALEGASVIKITGDGREITVEANFDEMTRS